MKKKKSKYPGTAKRIKSYKGKTYIYYEAWRRENGLQMYLGNFKNQKEAYQASLKGESYGEGI